jgi:integrase/recombinase XerC
VTQPEAEFQRFLDHLRVERRLAPRTLTLYGLALQRLQASAAAAGAELRAAQPHQIRAWAAQMRVAGLAPRSIALALAAWRGLYRWWGRDGLVAANPVDGLRPPKAAKPLPKALSVEQAVSLAAHESAVGDPLLAARDHAIVELLYGCGLRVGELVGLDRAASGHAAGWVDLDDASAHVLGKGSKRRSVPVGGAALQALRAWLLVRGQMARADEAALFVSRRGTRLSAGQLRTRLQRLAGLAGLPTAVHLRQPARHAAERRPAAHAAAAAGRAGRPADRRAPAHAAPQLRQPPAAVQR